MKRRRLAVRLESIAQLREARRSSMPDPVTFGALAEASGADLLSVHLREDRRFILERDVRLLRQICTTKLHVRMAPMQEMIKLAYDLKPDRVTLVPEVHDEDTVPQPFDVAYHRDHLRKYIQNLQDGDIEPGVLIEPDLDQLRAAHRIDAKAVMLDTGKYCDARGNEAQRVERRRLEDAVRAATKLGMRVSVGGGLTVGAIRCLADLPGIDDFHVGHGLVVLALMSGFDRATRDLLEALTWGG